MCAYAIGLDGCRKSCTVIINGEQVCIHDGTWQKCEVRCGSLSLSSYIQSDDTIDPNIIRLMIMQNGHAARDFIRQINNEYQKLNGLALVDEEALTLDDLI